MDTTTGDIFCTKQATPSHLSLFQLSVCRVAVTLTGLLKLLSSDLLLFMAYDRSEDILITIITILATLFVFHYQVARVICVALSAFPIILELLWSPLHSQDPRFRDSQFSPNLHAISSTLQVPLPYQRLPGIRLSTHVKEQ